MKQKKFTQEERIKKLEQVLANLYMYNQTILKEIKTLEDKINNEKE